MSLVWVRKLNFHLLPSSSASPGSELWPLQSAPCRRVCLLIPLFRKRKKGLKKTPFGSSTEWEQNVSLAGKNISWPALLRLPAALRAGSCGSSRAMGTSWWPLWGGSGTGRDSKHSQPLAEPPAAFCFLQVGKKTKKKGFYE